MKIADSVMLILTIGIPANGRAEFDNNVLAFFHAPACFAVGDGSQMRLTNNTIVGIQEHGGGAFLLSFGNGAPLPKVPVRVEARNNLFAFDGGPYFGQQIFRGESAEKNAAAVDWQGEGNLFCPYPVTTKGSDGKDVFGHPLDAWAKKLNRTDREPSSQIALWPHWKLAEALWSKDEDYFVTLRTQIEAVIPPESRREVGPQWDLIGPGEAYVRALAAAGTPVSEKDLLPEALPGGPCVLLRNAQEVRGFPTLTDACSAAMPDDVIELRTNRNVGDAVHYVGKRLLTIRAGAGYSPEVGNFHVTNGCQVILEGIRFAPGVILTGYEPQQPNQPFGQYVRIVNCSFQTRNRPTSARTGPISVDHGTGAQDVPLVIQNCWIDGTLVLESRPGQPIRLDNCILPKVDLVPLRLEDKDAWHRIEFNRCAVWSPEPRHGRSGLFCASENGPRHIEVVAHGTLFETPVWIRQDSFPLRWQGTKNLFRVGYPDWFHTADQPEPRQVISGLDDLRKAFQSDADSVEAHPLAWEPAQWKLLPTSPGYQTGPEGKDIGADIDRLALAIKNGTTVPVPFSSPGNAAVPTDPAAASTTPVTQPRKASDATNPEKPFALIRNDKIVRDFRTWAGMLADLQAGDTIEVQGRGPYVLPKPPFKHLDVTVRAAAGFRPELRLPGAILHDASLKSQGLDLVFPHDDRDAGHLTFFNNRSGPTARLEIDKCRVAAYAIQVNQNGSVKVSDSLLLVTSIVVPDDGEADFNNNVIVFSEGGFKIPQGGSNVRLTNNTIIAWGRLLFFGHPDATLPERPVRIESRNNLIANDWGFEGGNIFRGQSAEKNAAAIDWQGADNLYCPRPQVGFTEKNNDGETVQVEPLDAWARKLNRTEREPNSQIAAWPQWKLAETWWAKDADYFATLRRQIESAIPPERRHEIGPQWELIGPGAAYLKALAVAGTPVAEKDLLPEALVGGPCVILRDGKEIQGFRTLQDACSTAIDKDVIELRTNNNVGGKTLNGKDRLITIRAAAG